MPFDITVGRTEDDKELLEKAGLILLGKTYVKMGVNVSLSNPLYLDVARSHVILVTGKRGCLSGDTLIFTDKGYKKIRDFNDKEDKILTFNKEKREFEWENAELLEYDISKEKLLEIILEDGRILKLTKEHPLLLNYGKYIFWRMAQELKIRDKIVLPIKLPEIEKDKESLRIARILGFVFSDGTISKRKGRWKDGRGAWYNGVKSRLRIFCDDEDVLRIAKEDLEKEFGTYTKEYKRNDCNCSVVQSLHAKVVDKINLLGVPLGNKAGIIRIPKIVWESSNEFKANFISALFSCDGYIEAKGKTIDYSSKSRNFLEDIQLLLSHFSIESSIRLKKAKCNEKIYENYRLFITDNTSIENFKKIKFLSKFKQERLETHKSNNTKRRRTFYINDNLVCKRIKDIKEIEEIKVYDLSVNKNHSFIANGVISHNSGKSYSQGVIAEGVMDLPDEVRRNLSIIFLDTMGVFWTMKYENKRDEDLLQEWGLEPKKMDIDIYVPKGYYHELKEKGLPIDYPFAIQPKMLTAADWCNTFDIKMTSEEGSLISRAVIKLKGNYGISDILYEIDDDNMSEQKIKNIVAGLFQSAITWGLFDPEAVDLEKISSKGRISVVDLSCYTSVAGNWNIKALVVGLISNKILVDRIISRKKEELDMVEKGFSYFYKSEMESEMPMVWLFIDEAHEFLPKEGKTAATDALIALLREGRQPGISLVLATQQPGRISDDVITQADIVLCHRLTAKQDITALNEMMQSYMEKGLSDEINTLPKEKGAAVVLDDTSERVYPIRVRPRLSWHGGEAPSAVKIIGKRIKEF